MNKFFNDLPEVAQNVIELLAMSLIAGIGFSLGVVVVGLIIGGIA